MDELLQKRIEPDWPALLRCIRRDGTPDRVHHIELFLDPEVKDLVCQRFDLDGAPDPNDRHYWWRREIAIQRFLGYDYVRAGLDEMDWPMHHNVADDTAAAARAGGRSYIDEHTGPITSWADFERYPWPDPARGSTEALDFYQRELPDGMCIIGGGGFGHFAEHLVWLMGYETLCIALFEQRDLVEAIADRLVAIFAGVLERILDYDRVRLTWGSDDMGFRSGLLFRPDDMRRFVLAGHRKMAQMSHAAGRPYLLHSCGNLSAIMGDLIEDVRIDAKHSFEDTIEDVVDVKRLYGDRLTILGGIDVDFLCRADEAAIRSRVRETLDACMPGGGYVLGSGNSIANYVPLDHYLTMLDEGRRYA